MGKSQEKENTSQNYKNMKVNIRKTKDMDKVH
jgi:hypothetical protein